MKNWLFSMVLAGICLSPFLAHAQFRSNPDWIKTIREDSLQKGPKYRFKKIWDRKFNYGITFQMAWSAISEDGTADYFRKPSHGVGIRVTYFPIKYVGLGFGAQYMQRGAGIKTPDVDHGLGNPDSTNRLRLRMHSVELPFQLLLRSPSISSWLRFSGGIGIAPVFVLKTGSIFHSVEDGFHDMQDRSASYYLFDLDIPFSAGIEINASDAAIFQLHAIGSIGTQNVYRPSAFPNANGKNNYYGIRLSVLF